MFCVFKRPKYHHIQKKCFEDKGVIHFISPYIKSTSIRADYVRNIVSMKIIFPCDPVELIPLGYTLQLLNNRPYESQILALILCLYVDIFPTILWDTVTYIKFKTFE